MKKLCVSLRGVWILITCQVMALSASAAPIVFNSTESAYPGDVIYLQGDNFTATPTAWFYVVTGTEGSLAAPPASATELTNLTSSDQALTAAIPQNIPLGLYAVWIKDVSGDYTAPVFINRARATSFEYSQVPPGYHFRIFGRNLCLNGSNPYVKFVNTISSSTYSAVILTNTNIVSTSTNDSNVLMVQAPSGTSFTGTNTYYVEVSNGSGTNTGSGTNNYDLAPNPLTIQSRASGSDVFNLGVPWGADFVNIASSTINVLTGTNPHTNQLYSAGSGTNGGYWNNAIQQALYDAGNPTYHPNGATVYIPSGTYAMNWSYETGTTSGTIGGWNATTGTWAVSGTFIGPNGAPFDLDNPPNNQTPAGIYELDIPANVVLQGAGIGNTVFNDSTHSFGNNYNNFITLGADTGTVSSSHMGVQGFTYNQTFTVSATNGPPDIRSYATRGMDIFFDHIVANFASGVFNTGTFVGNKIVCGGFLVQGDNGDNVLVQSCTMSHLTFGTNNRAAGATFGNDYIFRNNSFTYTYNRLEFLYIGKLLIENNFFQRSGTFPPPTYHLSDGTGQGGIESSGPDKTILNNTLSGTDLPLTVENDGESILCQSSLNLGGNVGGATDSGTVSAAAANTLSDSAKSWTTNEFTGQILAITSGTGQGEWANIISNTGTSITISGTWAITPSGSSPASTFAVEQDNCYATGTATGGGTSTTLTDSTRNWPVNFYAGESVAIISGPGMGQVASITANSATTLTFSPAFAESASTSSVYSINGALALGAQRWLVKNNNLVDVPRGIILYLGGYDCDVVGNHLSSADGILLWGWQRSVQVSGTTEYPYNRFDIGWKNAITDNVVTDPNNNIAAYINVSGATTTDSPLLGTFILGTDNRRNLLQASNPNLVDTFSCPEMFGNYVRESTSGNCDSGIGVLDSVYTDNVSIDGGTAYKVSTAVSQTPIWDSATYNCGTLYSDTILPGCTGTADQTVTGTTADGLILDANFSGTGASIGTGSTGDNMVDVGATGKLVQGGGSNDVSIEDTTSFDSESGSYLHTVYAGTGNNSTFQFNPVSPRYSWSRIFDQRSGQWIVNGAFDFFYRPGQTNSSLYQFRPLDISSNVTTNGLRMIMNAASLTKLDLQFVSGTNGGGNLLMTGTIPAFQSGTVYHLGVTFSSDVTSGTTAGTNGAGANGTTPYPTTVKMYIQEGTGEMAETGATLIATGTMSLNHSVVNDTSPSDWFNGGSWDFVGYNVSGLPTTNDYDGFRMYYMDSGTFPALDDTNY